MARPTRNNAEYFSHDADMRNDVKVKALRRRFSHKGYAVWCFILEALTNESYFVLDFSEINRELLAADFDVSTDELKDIVDYCVKIGLLQQDGESIYSEAHQKRFSGLITKREANKERYQHRKQQNKKVSAAETVEKQDKSGLNNQSKVKESKVKESKEKKSIVYPYQDIADLWNSACNKLPKIQKVTEGRKQKIKCRFEEFGKSVDEAMAVYQAILEKVATSDFLCGGNNSNWTATFDWLFENSKNWVKVSEGNYDNKRGAKLAPVTASNNLGAGEYIDNSGKRTYGTGKANIPMSAPPRPSESYAWDESTKKWIML